MTKVFEFNGKEYTAGGLKNAIRMFGITSKQYYDDRLKVVSGGICKVCDKPTKWLNINLGYAITCGKSCNGVYVGLNNHKGSDQCFANRPESLRESREKAKVTISNRTNEQKLESRDRQRRSREVKMIELGNDHYSKIAIESESKKSPETRRIAAEKRKATLKRIGYEPNPFNYNFKELVIGDKVFKYQGYEDAVIKCLVKDCGVLIDDILVGKDTPRIKYGDKKTYYPDIFLAKMNLLIEVKSDYTYGANFDVNIEKQNASIEYGYKHIFIVLVDLNKDRTMKLNDVTRFKDMLISSQAS